MIYSSESKEISTISGVGKWPELASIEYFKSNSKNGIPSTIERAVTPAACDSWLTAIENFGNIKKRNKKKYFLFGDMLELGKNSQNYHKKISKFINNSDIIT